MKTLFWKGQISLFDFFNYSSNNCPLHIMIYIILRMYIINFVNDCVPFVFVVIHKHGSIQCICCLGFRLMNYKLTFSASYSFR